MFTNLILRAYPHVVSGQISNIEMCTICHSIC